MRSMTGFGRGQTAAAGWSVTVEISAVNRKQLDVAVNLPNGLAEREPEVKRQVGEAVSRGRVQVRVEVASESGGENTLHFDETLARQYVEAARVISTSTGVETRLAAADLFRAPGVFRIEENLPPVDEVCASMHDAIEAALRQLVAMQEREGDHLRSDLADRLGRIENEVASVAERAPRVVENYRKNLSMRLADSGLDLDLDDERVQREIGLYADRSDISEEVTRIESHVGQFRRYLDAVEPCGRPLDFLCQELNREINTIGSKANDSVIAQRVVEAKTELEKIREQVQNVQ